MNPEPDVIVKTGLVIGKFMPLHQGHVELIGFAAARCDELTVLVGVKSGDPIPGPLRLEWVKTTFSDNPTIRVDYTDDDLPDAPRSDREVSKVWAAYLKRRYPQTTTIFSSEPYGDYLAEYMGIRHVAYDTDRTITSVSGSAIRQNPLKHWDLLPDAVRPHFAKKVCVYGPESTGKTVMTEYLSRRFQTAFVPEMARVFFSDRMPANESEMMHIAELHANEITKRTPAANRILFVDTDHLTTKIYWQEFFGNAPTYPRWIEEANRYDLYLLLDIDVPWVADPLRECGDRRVEHFTWFEKELDQAGLPYRLISGSWDRRNRLAVGTILERWPELQTQLIDPEHE